MLCLHEGKVSMRPPQRQAFEVGVVLLSPSGDVEGEWTTLINPLRDVGSVIGFHCHGQTISCSVSPRRPCLHGEAALTTLLPLWFSHVMAEPPISDPIIDTKAVSQQTGIPAGTLRYFRHNDQGPASFSLGRRVVYRQSEVDRWIAEQERSTRRGGAA
jgi:predicted DNA-binding transcriptional regulator AlpA